MAANYATLNAAVKSQDPGSLVCEIKVTHNFFVEKLALLIDPARQPDEGKYCCVTSFKLHSEGLVDDETVGVTLLKAENDDHVQSKA